MDKKKIIAALIVCAVIISFLAIPFISDSIIGSEYDLIVVGSDPEGIAAAVSASRLGLRTLLIDKRDRLGGLMTLGGLVTIDMNYSPDGRIINNGIFMEFFEGIGRKTSFDVNEAEEFFENILSKEKVDVILGVKDIKPIIKDNTIKGVEGFFDSETIDYSGKIVIDATQDADIAAISGVPYTFGQEDIGFKDRFMVATLVFEVLNVNWDEVRKYLNNDGNFHTGADETSGWGYSIMYSYEAKNPRLRMRGLNIGRQVDGSVLINALQIFNVNPICDDSRNEAKEIAINELPYILDFMRENAPGFENAKLGKTAEELYIRESRHIIGEYRLTIDDVLENKYFKDTIAFGSYPVDVQSLTPNDFGMVVGNPSKYGIPFRCLVPKKIDNLLVVGKAASYDSLPAGSARTIPVGMSAAEAASVAAYYSINNNVSLRDIKPETKHIETILEKINAQGGNIHPFEYEAKEKHLSSYPYIKNLRSKGIVYGGYDNNYRVEELIIKKDLSRLLKSFSLNTKGKVIDYTILNENDKAVLGDVLNFISIYLDDVVTIEHMLENRMIKEETYNSLKEVEYPTYANIYMLLSDFLDYLENN